MIKKLLELILGSEELVKEINLDELEAVLKSVRTKKIEYLTFKKLIDVKETKNADGSIRIVAIASTDSVDRGMDVVIPTGIKTTNIKNGMIPMLLQHDHDKIIGAWDKWYVKDNTFVVEGTFLAPQTDWQKDAMEKVVAKALNGISIGFIIDKVSFNKDIRVLDEIELLEVSIVSIPMNQDCFITSVEKSIEDSSQKSATSVEVPPTTEPVVSPESNDTPNPEPSVDTPVAPVKDEEVVKLTEENEKLKRRISELETEVADYEAVMEETATEMEELLKSKRSFYEK